MLEDGFVSDGYVIARRTVKTNVSSRSAFDCHKAARRAKAKPLLRKQSDTPSHAIRPLKSNR
jgi:hypothetical protein